MRVLAFRHVPFEGVGLIGPVLAARGISIEYADLYIPGSSLPDPAAFEALRQRGPQVKLMLDPWR